ncbi:MAG: hypothetical protein LBT31_01220 [Synergistaceae bacterium]|jgi:hypothetical protein|nr:hypothetical protein [Synergistaceae bacterium]
MNAKNLNLTRRFYATLTLALFMFQFAPPLLTVAAAATWPLEGDVVLRAPRKSDVAVADNDDFSNPLLKANVLFLIDTTDAMSFTPNAVPPRVSRIRQWYNSNYEGAHYPRTQQAYYPGLNVIDEINKRMEKATFGIGALPTAWSGANLTTTARNLYGRDLNKDNNYVRHSNNIAEDLALNSANYYAPFAVSGATLKNGYSSQTTKLQVGYKDFDSVYGDGTISWSSSEMEKYFGTEQTNYTYSTNVNQEAAYPYALIFKNPQYWKTGKANFNPDTDQDELVPNDSRMYQTKLVLWKLLEEQNAEALWKNIRFGMATTFLSLANPIATTANYSGISHSSIRTDHGGLFKVYPWASNLWTQKEFYTSGPVNTPVVPNDLNNRGAGAYTSFGHATYSAETSPKTGTYGGNTWALKRWKNGAMSGAVTGNARRMNSIHSQLLTLWHNADAGAVYNPKNSKIADDEDEFYTSSSSDPEGRHRRLWKTLNRASLHVPIGDYAKTWTKGDKTITQAEKFRLWINGFADIKSGTGPRGGEDITDDTGANERKNQFHFYKDPEIGVAGHDTLAMAIFPNPTTETNYNMSRSNYNSKNWIWYSDKSDNVNYRASYFRVSTELQYSGAPKAYFNSGSGEATGSVLDFFSPLKAWKVTKANSDSNNDFLSISKSMNINNLSDVSFPIRNGCDPNWLVIVSSGAEPTVDDDSDLKVYHTWDAIKNLYDYADVTKPGYNKVTSLKRDYQGRPLDVNNKVISDDDAAKRVISEISLDKPIQTIVIGIVPHPDKVADADKPAVTEMRENVRKMARAGQGYPIDGNVDVAYFADDVASLTLAITDALKFISESSVSQQGAGALVEPTRLQEGDGASGFYNYEYTVKRGNQWEARINRYVLSRDVDDIAKVTLGWELGNKLITKRDSNAERDILMWNATAGAFKPVKDNMTQFAKLTGLTTDKIDASNLPDGTFPAGREPAQMFLEWLKGYEYSYKDKATYPRRSMLSDLGQSGFAVIDDPVIGSEEFHVRTGYNDFVTNMLSNPKPPMVYAQTNDGILHVINRDTGVETMAILPPPSLLPHRIASLKTRVLPRLSSKEMPKTQWLDVSGADSEKGGAQRSYPSYLLDGQLQAKRLKMSNGWGTYLIGTLGRGGGGIYMLDVTNNTQPKLVWYYDNLPTKSVLTTGLHTGLIWADYKPAEMKAGDSEPLHSGSSGGEGQLDPLQPNMPKPTIFTTADFDKATPELNNYLLMGSYKSETYSSPSSLGDYGQSHFYDYGAEDPGDDGKYLIADLYGGKPGLTVWNLEDFDAEIVDLRFSSFLTEEKWRRGNGKDGWLEYWQPGAPYMSSITSEGAVLRSERSPYTAGSVFFADRQGNIFRLIMEEKDEGGVTRALPAKNEDGVDLWKLRTVASLQTTRTIPNELPGNPNPPGDQDTDDLANILLTYQFSQNYNIPHGVALGLESRTGDLWVGGGTADVPVFFDMLRYNANLLADSGGFFRNESQMIFSFRTNEKQERVHVRGEDFQTLTGEEKMTDNTKWGWYMPLAASPIAGKREYTSANPLIVGSNLYIATFTETSINIDDASLCAPERPINGYSSLYALDMTNGGAVYWDGADNTKVKSVKLDGIKITGMSAARVGKTTSIFVTYDNLSGAFDPSHAPSGKIREVKNIKTLMELTDVDAGSGSTSLSPSQTVINYWLSK